MTHSAAKAAKPSATKKAHLHVPSKERERDLVDPEGCYRRGFEHGAYLTFESAKHLFDSEAGRERLREWVEVELRQWRLAARETGVRPPTPPE
jgi:hypothetical protein